ncbi:hypothetical protein D3C73_278730 [compost metagenome]
MNDRIQEIKQRQAEATPGPWTHSRLAPGYVVTDDDKFDVVASVVEYRENGTIESKFCGDKSLANREFIAHAPDDIAYLLSVVERLQTENEQLSNEMDSMMVTLEDRDPYAAERYWNYLLTEREQLVEALKWTKKRYEEEWTYEPGIGEVVEEIIQRFEQKQI